MRWNLASNPPEAAPSRVEFVDAFGEKSSLTWDRLPSETTNPVTVWMERKGAPREVTIRYEAAKRLDQSLAEMAAGAKGK